MALLTSVEFLYNLKISLNIRKQGFVCGICLYRQWEVYSMCVRQED